MTAARDGVRPHPFRFLSPVSVAKVNRDVAGPSYSAGLEFELTGVAQSVELAEGMGGETMRASRLTATPAMTEDNQLSFNLPCVSRKKVTAAFDGGRLSSDSGVMLLALADRRRAVANTLAALIADNRDPSHITHTVADVLRTRMLAIGCGYPDGGAFKQRFCASDRGRPPGQPKR